MRKIIPTKSEIQIAVKHFVLADIFFSVALVAIVEFILWITFGNNRLFVWSGVVGVLVEALFVWFTVRLSAKVFHKKNSNERAIVITILSTILSLIAILILEPYSANFAEINKMTVGYLRFKDAVHVAVFFISTLFYFGGNSIRGKIFS